MRLISPRRLASRIPADLERICLKCLEQDPSRRYQTAGAVRDDLQQFLDGKPVSIHPVGPVGRAVRWARHRPLVATLASGLVLALSIGLLATAWLWRRAEAQYRSTFEAFDQLFEMARRSLGENQKLPMDYCIERLEMARIVLLQTAQQRAGAPEIWRLLAQVDLVIGRAFEDQGKLIDARPRYEESLSAWEKTLQANPADRFAQHCRFDCVLRLARTVERDGNADVSARHWERAVTLGEALRPDLNDIELGMLAECQTRLQLQPLRQAVDQGLEQWFAREVRRRDEVRRDQKVAPESLGEEADEIVDLLAQLGQALELSGSPFHRGIVGMTDELCTRAAGHRKAGRLDEADQTVAFLMALARRLVTRYPNRAAAHWALSTAYLQSSKKARRANDREAIERYLKLSIDAAHHALVLDPGNARIRHLLAACQGRLDDLLAPPKSPDAPDSAARPGKQN
jgi:tetratricopeptide (TPR) repeat protein